MSPFALALVCFSTVYYTEVLTIIQATNISGSLVEEFTVANSSRRLSDFDSQQTQRIVNQVSVNPVIVTLNGQSSLNVQPGQEATLYIDISNNNNWRSYFYFYCNTLRNTVQAIQPYEGWIAAGGTLTVRVLIRINGAQTTSGTDTVTFTAVALSSTGGDPTYLRTYLYIGQQEIVTDSSSPDVSYSINGNCLKADTPSTCSAALWGFTASIRDKQSVQPTDNKRCCPKLVNQWNPSVKLSSDVTGLLSVETIPPGFVITSDFIAGTKDEVSGRFSASCCLNQVDLVATDLNGNQDRTSIDINNIWLPAGAIVAIVLGSILIVLLLIGICCAVGICIRRRRKTSSFTMHT